MGLLHYTIAMYCKINSILIKWCAKVQGVQQNMTVGKEFRMLSCLLSCLIPKTITKLLHRSHILMKTTLGLNFWFLYQAL